MAEEWLKSLAASRTPRHYERLLTFDVGAPHVANIQNELFDAPDGHIRDLVAKYSLEWPGLADLSRTYLEWCRLVDPSDALGSFDLYAREAMQLAVAFGHPKGAVLTATVVSTLATLGRLFGRFVAHRTWLTSLTLRVFNSIRAERTPEAPKRPALLPVAVALLRNYFALGQYSACSHVFANIPEVKNEDAPLRYRVEYAFWHGRWYLYRNDIAEAYKHLRWCYEHCDPTSGNRVRMLQWLVVPSMLMGRLPTLQLLESLGLRAALEPVLVSLKTGVRCYDSILLHPWVVQRHLGPVLETHMPLLVARQALRRLLLIAMTSAGAPTSLPLSLVQKCLELSHNAALGPLDPDYIAAEGVCAALIGASFLKANVLPASQVLRLRPHNAMPPLIKLNRIN